jgi:hypothetical protein
MQRLRPEHQTQLKHEKYQVHRDCQNDEYEAGCIDEQVRQHQTSRKVDDVQEACNTVLQF